MFHTLASIYITFLPVVLAGVVNAIFCKSNFLNSLYTPIDRGLKLKDGKRLFGDHKTFKGVIGYVVLTALFMVIFGLISSKVSILDKYNLFYTNHNNTLVFNLLLGLLLGFAWAIFELPNSFIKRRLDISPGNTSSNLLYKVLFIFLDQADSIFGVVLVLTLFYPLSLVNYLFFVLVGALTHIIFNYLLYVLKIRKRPV